MPRLARPALARTLLASISIASNAARTQVAISTASPPDGNLIELGRNVVTGTGTQALALALVVDPASDSELAAVATPSELLLVDLRVPQLPVVTATIPLGSLGLGTQNVAALIEFDRRLALAPNNQGALAVVDPLTLRTIGVATHPLWTGTHAVAHDPRRNEILIAHQGPILRFSPGGPSGAPIFTGAEPIMNATALAVAKDLVAVSLNGRIHLRDAANSFALLGTLPIDARRLDFTREGDLLLAAERGVGQIHVIDTSSPTNPSVLASIPIDRLAATPLEFIERERLLYIGSRRGTRIFDVSEPRQPREVGLLAVPATPIGIAAGGPSGNLLTQDADGTLAVLRAAAGDHDYGPATTGGNARTPTIHPFGSPYSGNSAFGTVVEGTHPLATGLILTSPIPTNRVVAGVTVLVDPFGFQGSIVPVISDLDGRATSFAAIPNSLQHLGLRYFAQYIAADPTSPTGGIASRGTSYRIFLR
ncbi:MAG: hypothetical protein AB7I19_19500 [Planctomycetota bacterium]